MPADLHVHTRASDSTLSPREAIEACRSARVQTVAITDHDTVAGIREASDAGRAAGVRVIPGVEMTAYVGPQEIHVVGLFIDPAHRGLIDVLTTTRTAREMRVHTIVARLRALGIDISAEDVFRIAGAGAPGRVHVAQALIKSGRVSSIADAFNYYIGSGKPAYVPKHQLTPAQAAETIHAAAGVAVIAHPGAGLPDELVRRTAADGMDGIEVYHPLHDPGQSNHYLALAAELGLLTSGGTDCHGAVQEGAQIGTVTIPDEWVDRIEQHAAKRRNGER